MGAKPIRIYYFIRDFVVTRGTSQLQKSCSHFPEEQNGRPLTKHWFEKIQNGDEVHRTSVYPPPPPKAYFSTSVVRCSSVGTTLIRGGNAAVGINYILAFRITKIAQHISQHFQHGKSWNVY
jgi:hypothetical protein